MLKIIYRTVLPAAVSVFMLVSCSGHAEDAGKEEEQDIVLKEEDRPVEVSTLILEEAPFYRELFANGKLSAPERADLRFMVQGTVKSVNVQEGQQVAAGQLIAELDDEEPLLAWHQSELDHYRATLDYEDHLLRLGYRLADTASLSAEVKKIARLRSGLLTSEAALERAKQQLSYTKLAAPFPGKIANLKAKPHNSSGSFEYICTLIDDRQLEVEFKVLEQEIPFIRASKKVSIATFNEPETWYEATIGGLNPLIDETGMITVKAKLTNQARLLDGMGVKVRVRQLLSDQLSVPKEAVLDRQGRKVVFTYKDGIALWNYVEIAHENSTHFAISEGLNPGDEVIYQGNFNLAHEREVVKLEQ